jgi:hypothetical protein
MTTILDCWQLYPFCMADSNLYPDSNTSLLWPCYTNDTCLDGKTVLMGSPAFRVKKIEMSEMTD